MALTYQTYTGNGSLTTFPISFDWVNSTDVLVTVDGVTKVNGTDYTIVNKNVVFTAAPSSGTSVKVARASNITSRNVDFVNGSRLDESDLDNSAKQFFNLIQELWDRITDVAAQVVNIANGALVDESVTSTKLATDAVITTKVADGAITGPKVAAGAIVPSKMSTGGPSWDSAGTLTATAFSGPLTGNAATATRLAVVPAFRAFSSTNQSLSASTFTKITLGLEEYDTNTAFDTATSRFTPQVAGYYLINGRFSISASTQIYALLYKNGAEYTRGTNLVNGATAVINSLVFLNGTTDFVEMFGWTGGASTVNPASLDGILIRPA